MTRKNLKDAVLDVAVRYYTFPAKTFSAYDITKQLRIDVNAKQYDIAEFAGTPTAHGQEVSHSQVRDTVADLHNSQHFDRKYNGTFFEYSIGTMNQTTPVITLSGTNIPVAAKPDITTDTDYIRMVNILARYSSIDLKLITPASLIVKGLGFDDLDFVEAIMELEEEFRKELNNNDLDTDLTSQQKIQTVSDLYNFLRSNISKVAQNTITVPAALAPAPIATPPAPKDVVLKMYIQARHKKGTSPSLKNAQKALGQKGTSVRQISDIAKGLGYKVKGSTQVPFSEWVIAR